ncbi:hypothetical protein [Evansella tamaricis]|uniref:Nucleotidase n=1 Tax=Evansella tamaricis TaxID=2069301 RepID=A0ABS6JF13_9BACI|nr:hypothetical protein [Evansella tamaricis]MBU9712098.1 hypothetical protein [Evansella tamaricis]
MKKRRFGIDIDGTVTDPATFVPYLNEHFNKSFTLDDLKEYELSGLLGITPEEFWKWMLVHEKHIYSNSNLAAHAKGILTDWNMFHELFYISARSKEYHDITTDWFNRQELPFHHIELLGSHNKLEAVKKHGVDIFFEDKHDNACAIAEECKIPVILMDTPYNRESVPTLVYRVDNWIRAKETVDTLFN